MQTEIPEIEIVSRQISARPAILKKIESHYGNRPLQFLAKEISRLSGKKIHRSEVFNFFLGKHTRNEEVISSWCLRLIEQAENTINKLLA